MALMEILFDTTFTLLTFLNQARVPQQNLLTFLLKRVALLSRLLNGLCLIRPP